LGYFVSADADHNAQHFDVVRLLRHRRIEAAAALFDRAEMKRRDIGDRLNVIVAFKIRIGCADVIGIGSGNRGNSVESDRLRKGSAEIGICLAAVANEPTGVDVQIHQVRDAQLTG